MDNHTRLRKNAQKLYARFALSLGAILTFIAIAVNAHLISRTGQIGIIAIIPIAIALFSLPRYTRAGFFVPNDDETPSSEPEADKLLRIRLAKLADLTIFLRIAYLVIVIACYSGLPLIAPSPS